MIISKRFIMRYINQIKGRIFLFCLVCLLTSCSRSERPLNMVYKLNPLISIHKGMGYSDFNSNLDDWALKNDYDSLNLKEYNVQLDTLLYNTVSMQVVKSTTRSKDSIINHSYPYVFTFKDDKLFYWGYIFEYTRHHNIEIKEIGELFQEVLSSEEEDEDAVIKRNRLYPQTNKNRRIYEK